MKTLLLSVLMLGLAACGVSNTAALKDANNFEDATVIDMTGLDGCSFMLRLDATNQKLEADIPKEFQVNNLAVKIKYVPQARLSICMAGKGVKLTAIEKR